MSLLICKLLAFFSPHPHHQYNFSGKFARSTGVVSRKAEVVPLVTWQAGLAAYEVRGQDRQISKHSSWQRILGSAY